ncbi:ABC transporter ATP-binding protein [Qipengyuania citrea]|uniref:ABC transporter ATP-binding protein n=1 Tax=Qipengyuania citrea TaxID=225971 RepID=UPI00329A390D
MPSDLAAIASLRRVSKRMGTTLALNEVSLGIRPGEVTALLGPNGAGKSTAVGLLTGRLLADAGTVDLFGLDPRRPAARARIGVMLQSAALPDVLTVDELVALQSGYFAAARPLEETLAFAGLSDLEDRRAGALSGGQSRRLQFALAICGRPDLLILDEPTTGLDTDARRALWTTVRDTADTGAGVLLTTHYLEEAEALADRIVVIADGRIVADGTTADIRAGTAGATIRCRTRLADEVLASLPGVRRAQRAGGEVRILSGDAAATMRALFDRTDDCTDLRVETASLEDALSTLTNTAQKEAA